MLRGDLELIVRYGGKRLKAWVRDPNSLEAHLVHSSSEEPGVPFAVTVGRAYTEAELVRLCRRDAKWPIDADPVAAYEHGFGPCDLCDKVRRVLDLKVQELLTGDVERWCVFCRTVGSEAV